jgi:hypothetical protein
VKSVDYSTGEVVFRSAEVGVQVNRVGADQWVMVDSDEMVLAKASGLDQQWSLTGGGTMRVFKKLTFGLGEALLCKCSAGVFSLIFQ